ncbi:IS200/IS605 family transposase, partial [Synechococcales cyanobacterium C]
MTYRKLSHTVWECKYHIVFIPKYRKKVIYGNLRRKLGEIFHELARHKESVIEEGHLLPDHVHMLISIPPKYAVSNVVGYLKGKSAIYIAWELGNRRNATGHRFWARGYFVATVGRDEEMIRKYIQQQEEEDRRLEQMNLVPPEFVWSKIEVEHSGG